MRLSTDHPYFEWETPHIMNSPISAAPMTLTGTGEVHVTDQGGAVHTVTVRHGSRLMPELKSKGVGVIGMCGGQAACGTCHVYVGPGWNDALPARDEYEIGMLDELESAQDNSRLACQIVFREGLHGLELAVAPHD